jgi:hypothetical protein
MPRTFHKTTIEIIVLSKKPYDPNSLYEVACDIEEDNYPGNWDVTKTEEIDGPTMAELLNDRGVDPECFQLDEEGNDLNTNEEQKE